MITRLSPFLLTFIAVSCSPRTSSIDLTRTNSEEIIRRVEVNNDGVTNFQASGTVSIESREFVGTGSISVSIKRPDSILIKIEGPFGIDIGTMLLTKDRFTYYDSYSNRVITGATTNRNIRSLLRVELGFSDVMDFLSGTTSLGRQSMPPDSLYLEGDLVILLFKNGASTARYWIDPDKHVVVRYDLIENHESSASGTAVEPLLETHYGRFTSFKPPARFAPGEKMLLPRSISITASRQKRGLSLHYDEIEINKPLLNFTFSIPETAKRIYW